MKKILFCLMLFFPQWSYAVIIDRIAAIVNTQVITLYDVDKTMVEQVGQIQNIPDPARRQAVFKKVQAQALNMLVEEALLKSEMKKLNITVTDADVNNAVASVAQNNQMTEAQFAKELQRKGRSLASFKEELRQQLRRVKFVREALAGAAVVTDADIDEFIKANSDKLGGSSQVKISQLILRLDGNSSQLEQQRAKAISDKVQEEGTSLAKFKSLAKKYSDERTLANVNSYSSSDLQEGIREALSGQKVGTVSRPILTNSGVLLVFLVERKSEVANIDKNLIRDQVRDKVYEWKVQKALRQHIDKLKRENFVEVKI